MLHRNGDRDAAVVHSIGRHVLTGKTGNAYRNGKLV
jgi:hypothetical protein